VRLLLRRLWRKEGYTVGTLSIDGERFCETLEDRDRGLSRAMGEAQVRSLKVYGETAIPTGTYSVRLSRSVAFAAKPWAKRHGGMVPEVQDVPGFTGVRMHPGNTAADSQGCILVGRNTVKGGLTRSQETWHLLMARLEEAAEDDERIYLDITY